MAPANKLLTEAAEELKTSSKQNMLASLNAIEKVRGHLNISRSNRN